MSTLNLYYMKQHTAMNIIIYICTQKLYSFIKDIQNITFIFVRSHLMTKSSTPQPNSAWRQPLRKSSNMYRQSAVIEH